MARRLDEAYRSSPSSDPKPLLTKLRKTGKRGYKRFVERIVTELAVLAQDEFMLLRFEIPQAEESYPRPLKKPRHGFL